MSSFVSTLESASDTTDSDNSSISTTPVSDQLASLRRILYRRKTFGADTVPLKILVTTEISFTSTAEYATPIPYKKAPPAKPLILPTLKNSFTKPILNKITGPVTIRSPAERKLCEVCAKFNWEYHLTKEIPGLKRSRAFNAEEALNGDPLSKRVGLYPSGRRKITGAPYAGTYDITYASDEMELDDLPSMMRKRLDCTLCALVVDALESQILLPSALERLAERAHLQPTRCSIKSATTTPNQHVLSILPFMASSELQFTLTGYDSAPPLMNEPWQYQLDFQMIRSWMKSCKDVHVHKVTSEGESTKMTYERSLESYLKVIDVNCYTIVPAPLDCEYVALSYVWGDFEQPSSQTAYSSGNGYFAARLNVDSLPKTILDAIYLTRLIGLDYLWVDSLCIDQNDLLERGLMIHMMHQVYRSAALTVIAADGIDSNAGLPGVFSTQRKIEMVKGSIDGINLVAAETPALNLKNTIWGTRGWAYQERWFSTKSLIFANQRVYYECSEGLYSELEPLTPMPSAESYSERRSTRYADHVRYYTARKLTFDHDILNAFKGILADEKARYGTTFCWGMPTEDIVMALQWRNATYTNTATTGKFAPLERRPIEEGGKTNQFPSWAWSGWKGAVYYENWTPQQNYSVKFTTQFSSLEDEVYQTGILDLELEMSALDSIEGLDIYMDEFDVKATTPEEYVRLMTMDRCLISRTYSSAIFLLVEEDGFGVYRRRGCGTCPLDKWRAAGPRSRQIRLG